MLAAPAGLRLRSSVNSRRWADPGVQEQDGDSVSRKCIFFQGSFASPSGGTSARSLHDQHETASRRQRDLQFSAGG